MKLKEKRQKSQKERRSFLEWYEQKPRFRKILLNNCLAAVGIPLCIIVSAFIWVYAIGNGAHNYSENSYSRLKSAVEANVDPTFGINFIELEKVADKVVLESGHGTSKLVVSIKRGYFQAEVTAILENFAVKEKTRNFYSLAEYMKSFWIKLILYSVSCGVASWFAIITIVHFILFDIAFLYRRFTEKKNVATVDGSPLLQNNVPESNDGISATTT